MLCSCQSCARIARAGDHVARAGDHVSRAGDHVARAGDHVARAGDHIERAGDHVARAGDHIERAGDHIERVGDRCGAATWRPQHRDWVAEGCPLCSVLMVVEIWPSRCIRCVLTPKKGTGCEVAFTLDNASGFRDFAVTVKPLCVDSKKVVVW